MRLHDFPEHFCGLCAASSTVKASVVNHCSLLPYNKEVLDQIAQPVLFQCSDNDAQVPAELRHQIEEKLSQKPFKRHTLVKFYPGELEMSPQADYRIADYSSWLVLNSASLILCMLLGNSIWSMELSQRLQ